MSKRLAGVIRLFALCVACFAALARAEQPRELKVLFVGDSFTFVEGGVWTHVSGLAHSDGQGTEVKTDHVTVGGPTLKHLWELGDAVKAIDTKAYDVVVLQDDIPEINVDYFREYTKKFVEEVVCITPGPFFTWRGPTTGWGGFPWIRSLTLTGRWRKNST